MVAVWQTRIVICNIVYISSVFSFVLELYAWHERVHIGAQYLWFFFSHQLDVLLHTHKTTHQDVWAKVKRLFKYRLSFVLLGQQKDMGRMIYKQILTVGNHIIDIARAWNIMHQQDPQWRMMSRIEPHFECRCTVKAENIFMLSMYDEEWCMSRV